jgi:hypothetical protein
MQELRSTTSEDAQVRRERFAEDGYLLLRGLVDIECLEQLAVSVEPILRDLGLLTADDRAVDTFRATRGAYYRAVQRLEVFHALAHDPALQRAVRALVGDDAFVHPQRLLRTLLPGVPELVTPPHQDFAYIGGAETTVTTWLPPRRCHVGEGGLGILVGSHKGGLLPMQAGDAVSVFRVEVAEDEPAWASADFDQGDALIFHSKTVHSATPNTSDRIRLSADYRHQSASEPISARWLKPRGYPEVPDWPELLADVSWDPERWFSIPAEIEIVGAAPRVAEARPTR